MKGFFKIYRAVQAAMFLTAIFMSSTASAKAEEWRVGKEHLTYNVMYKWGLINKKAGSVEISTAGTGGKEFHATLTAATAPWAEHIYHVRDTLLGNISTATLQPSRYERIAHEGSHFSHDILTYTRDGNKVTADARIWRKKKKEAMWSDRRVHSADGVTLDMLSSFYFMRHLDFASMKPGESVTINIFSGKKKEFLTIRFKGADDVKLDKAKYPAYHITFTFTQEGGKISSDNMDAWISTNSKRIPLLLEGKLPVGKVRAVYSGSTETL